MRLLSPVQALALAISIIAENDAGLAVRVNGGSAPRQAGVVGFVEGMRSNARVED